MRATDQPDGAPEGAKDNGRRPDPADIARRIQGPDLPPVAQWHPERCGEIDMRIARDGSWTYFGSPIARKRMVRLFSTVLRRDDDGIYYLVTPAEKLAIQVEDVPFVAVEMTVHGSGREQVLVFRTNVDDEIMAGPDHPIRVRLDTDEAEPAPYIHVRDRLDALIARAVFYDLVELGVEETHDGESYLGVWSAGRFFPMVPAAALEDE